MKNLTEVIMILDRSGSMGGRESDTIGGFNAFLKKQKKEEGEAVLSTVLFDDRMQVIHDRLPIEKVPEMNEDTYTVGGCTALLDAIGTSVRHIEKMQKLMPENTRPEHTIVVITTDGLENASREYSYSSLSRLISQQKEKGWEFLFLGANMDAIQEASRFGIDADHSVTFENDGEGIAMNYEAVSDMISASRASAPMAAGVWKKKIEKRNRRR